MCFKINENVLLAFSRVNNLRFDVLSSLDEKLGGLPLDAVLPFHSSALNLDSVLGGHM